jgi:hypothetical protein
VKEEMKNNISKLIKSVRESAESGFYRDMWGNAEDFDELPLISRDDFLRIPLSKRRYKNDKALVKIVHTPEGPFLSEWSFEDIGREEFGLISARPMVYLTDSHEAMEKSMWCYENNMVPLVGEKDPNVAMFAAGKYKIDSLITDVESLAKFLPYLAKRGEKLSCISILGDSFDIGTLKQFLNFSDAVRLVLCLPETGVIATALLGDELQFKTVENSFIEKKDGFLVVTKLSNLVIPIIRYKTSIPADTIKTL